MTVNPTQLCVPTVCRIPKSISQRLLFAACLALVSLVWGATPLKAQVTGEISGRVEDATGGGLSGATVTAKSLETGATKSTTTDATGNFEIFSLSLGPQEIRAEKTGFKTTVHTGINLEVGQNATVILQLEVGEVVQEITVVSDAPVVNTTTSSIAGLVGEQEVKDLPLNGRSFDNLITLNPGTINYALKSANTSTSNGNTFSVAGRRTAENLFLLNGIEYTGSSQLAITPGGVSGQLLGIDAVREFNVLTNNYSAAYGKRAGAQVSVVTQSGTNNLHGSVFEFMRNSAVDARNYFTLPGVKPPFEQNQFGGALGGPLEKDRWFVFGNYEGFRQAYTLSSVSVVPDAEARMGFLWNTSTNSYQQVSNLNSAMLNYMTFWPQPDPGASSELLSNGVPSGTAFSHSNPKQYIREDFGTFRTDYYLSSTDTITGAYTVDDGNSRIPLVDPLFASVSTLRMQVASLQEMHTFSPDLLNTARFGFSRAGFNLISDPLTSIPSSLDFVTGAGPGGITIGGGVSTTSGNGTITAAGPNNAAGVWNRRNLFTYTDDIQLTRGKHQLSFGVWFQRLQDNEFAASRQAGVAAFANLTSFLQGNVTGTGATFQVVPSAHAIGWRSLFGAWYVDDTIKLNRRLTLEAGLRHEFTTGWNAVQGRAADYVTDSTGVLVTNPVVGGSVFTTNNAKKLFSPRVSLAWDPFGNGKTAVRAGFGTYYSLIDDLSFLLNSLPPYNGSLTFTGALSSIAPIAPGFSEATCGPGVPPPCATYAPQGVQPNAKTPTVEEWNFGIERELNQSTSVRVSYLGSHGYHGFVAVDPNSIPAQICATATCASGGVGTAGTVTQGTQYIPIGTRPNKYLSAGFFWYNEGNSSYNALQTEVNHRFTHDLQFRANYTWSKNLDTNSALTIAQSSNEPQMIMDRNDLRRDWGPSALNATNQASVSARYELPIGPGKHWLNSTSGVASKLAGGWQLNGVSTFLSGFPFTPLVGSNRSGDGDTRNPDRPNFSASFTGPVVTGNPAKWFNPAAFALPTLGTYGNVGRGSFSGPGLADVDFSVFKTTSITERVNLQFRTEVFNIFNRVNFGPPNTTVFSGTSVNASAGFISTLATNPRQIQFGLKLLF
ncbi:MAG TPA: carboxypeptidase regulatory-like domain-containing protein [Candidatus Acidoferrum sp.]|nr:carboxypeptidase regulatory-like domain-containing protein [Candidatus Acidoferrum sp.]